VTTKTFKRIILHGGLHKTGTTSIQDNCFKYRDVLLRHGIVYPSFEFGGRRYVNHSDPIATAITKQRVFYGAARRLKNFRNPRDATRILWEQLRNIMEEPAGETLLLSAEIVCDFIERDMKLLRRYLEQYTDDLDVIAVVRSPHDSLISIVQQRCRDGYPSDPAEFFEVTFERYQRLKLVFSDRLRAINFHQATAHPRGLVGFFLKEIGLPDEAIEPLEFISSNERISMEAFVLMNAINEAFPLGREGEHGIVRQHRDMLALHALPGQPFLLTEPLSDDITRSLEEQRKWLERELQTTFPAQSSGAGQGALWQPEVLQALESTVNLLDHRRMREVVRDVLVEESGRIGDERPADAAVLKHISDRISLSEDPPVDLILQKLGADYFKFAALQLQESAPDMSLLLMLMAKNLRPDAPFIEERIQHYRDRLKESG